MRENKHKGAESPYFFAILNAHFLLVSGSLTLLSEVLGANFDLFKSIPFSTASDQSRKVWVRDDVLVNDEKSTVASGDVFHTCKKNCRQ